MKPQRLVLLTLIAFSGLSAQSTFQNPVIGTPLNVKERVADPHVLKFNGEYYLYATGNPIIAYHSTDLAHWNLIGPVLTVDPGRDAWNQTDVWAPEVVYRNGKFYMHYSASRRSATDWRIEEMARRVGVAVSDSPRGPFVDSGTPVTSGWAIDGHIFLDPASGADYLFYSYLDEPRLPGAGIVADRMTSPFTLAGRPARITRGSEPWEDKDGDPGNGSVRYTNEGPTVVEHNGNYFMMYSGGSWDLPSYSLAYAASPRLPEGSLDGPGWTKSAPPILRSTPLVEGPGHNCAVKGPNNVDDFTLYHARVVPFRDPGDRIAFLGRLFWMPGRIFLDQPSLALQPSPDAPLFADRFDRANGVLGPHWRSESGQWTVQGEAARQSSTVAEARAFLETPALSHYILEVNVKSPGAAGVTAWWKDSANHVDVLIDQARRALVLSGAAGGKPIEEQSIPLPEGFVFDAWHQLVITKNAATLRVSLDGVRRLSFHDNAIQPAAGAALLTRSSVAEFDGVALASWFEDTFDSPEITWTRSGGAWFAEAGALHQVAGGAARAIALKGDPATNYELTGSVRWRDDDGPASSAGLVAASAGGDAVLAGFDHAIWPFARFRVRHISGASMKQEISVELPRGFQYSAWHTIRVVRRGADFTFFLDGQEMAAGRFGVGDAQTGLFTEGVRAAFTEVSVKRTGGNGNLLLDPSFDTQQWNGANPAPGSVWKLAGAAQGVYCCGHTGVRQMVVGSGTGTAAQSIPTLAAGDYTLSVFVKLTPGAAAEVAVNGKALVSSAHPQGAGWTLLSAPYRHAAAGPAAIEFRLTAPSGPGARAALDDVYLAAP